MFCNTKIKTSYVSANPAITLNDVKINKIDWREGGLAFNPNMPLDFLKTLCKWSWYHSPHVTPKDIPKEFNDGIPYQCLAYNPHFTWEDVQKLPHYDSSIVCVKHYITCIYKDNLPVYSDFIMTHECRCFGLMLNPNFTTTENRSELSFLNPKMSIDKLKEYKINPRDWFYISSNPAFTLNDNLPWNYNGLSQNANITADFVLERINKDWDITKLMANPSLSSKDKLIILKLK